MPQDQRVDAYIAAAAPFAQPILRHLRALVHATCPAATEAIKWGRPFFLIQGRPLAMMAAFKAHASFGFWRGDGVVRDAEGGGDFGKVASLADLPGEAMLRRSIEAAAACLGSEVPRRPKRAPKPPIAMPDDLAAALATSPAAQAAFAALAPSYARDYLAWITEAKRAATRETRIAKAVALLEDGKTLHGHQGA